MANKKSALRGSKKNMTSDVATVPFFLSNFSMAD